MKLWLIKTVKLLNNDISKITKKLKIYSKYIKVINNKALLGINNTRQMINSIVLFFVFSLLTKHWHLKPVFVSFKGLKK